MFTGHQRYIRPEDAPGISSWRLPALRRCIDTMAFPDNQSQTETGKPASSRPKLTWLAVNPR
ncbi:hypothetical protein UVI_02026080 [Ustilaginoidea virens]|uniref:Uncharacterized protein n=1 Tax=Ustilaginoidea virens TaxID=1159556 RepID=A0A1B5KS36_USTVR|nr:hypothetical protein UVI_02026080 [Ustilaginoidea virens]